MNTKRDNLIKRSEIIDIFDGLREALEKREPWSYDPESAEYCEALLWHDPDYHDEDGNPSPDGWKSTVYIPGYSLHFEDGKAIIYEDLWSWDGNWDIVNSQELTDEGVSSLAPTYEELSASWANYASYVIRAGEDPLSEYFIQQKKKSLENWDFKLRRTIAGLKVQSARHPGKKWGNVAAAPKPILDFLGISIVEPPALPRVEGYGSDEYLALLDENEHTERKSWGLRISMEVELPRERAQISRDLIKAAKRNLKRHQANA